MFASFAAAAQSSTDVRIAVPEARWVALIPALILGAGALVLLLLAATVPVKLPKHLASLLTAGFALGSAVAAIPLWHQVVGSGKQPFGTLAGAVNADGFGTFMTWVVCFAVLVVALLLDGYQERESLPGIESYALLLLSAFGAVCIATANDLMVLFVGIEIMSIAVYVLASMNSHRIASQEAGLKYFILGGFASAFLLFGIALTYGATGTTNLGGIASFLSGHVITDSGLLMGALAFLLVGFAFKIAAVPFHSWAPDVYQGSPTPLVGYMASAVKAGAFAGMVRLFVSGVGPTQMINLRPVLVVLGLLSMFGGAVLAVVQSNTKRMLAYSSISHAGFMLMGVAASSPRGTSSLLFYLAVYACLACGSFGFLTLLGRQGDGLDQVSDLHGLGRSRPGLAFAFAVLLFAQAGTPFTGGFTAKFGVLAAALETHATSMLVMAIGGMLSAVISAYLYLRIIGSMFFGGDEGDGELAGPPIVVPWTAAIALALCLIGVVLTGLFPSVVGDLARQATAALTAG